MAAAKRGARTGRPATAKQNRENPEALDVDEISIEIEELDQYSESINWLLYGPSGHGKTRLAGGAPRSCFISTEKGVISARRAGSKAKLMRAPDWEHVVAAKRYADGHFGAGDWVILDSLTKMQVLMIRWILKTIAMSKSNRDLDIPAIQDHQKWQNYFKRFVDSLIDAPYNVIFICTEMYREDQDGETIVLPAITGKDYEICNYVRAQMDIVSYMAVTDKTPDGEPVRRLLFQPYPPYEAKDRYDILGRYQDVADHDDNAMAEFIEMIESVTV